MGTTEPGACDVAVVGAGIVGLATARELLRRRPGLRVMVIDKESTVAAHQTGHNSGVLHAGLYYTPGSLKARLCRSGKAELEEYAEEHGIHFETCGKLVVATSESEVEALGELQRRGEANGVPGLEMLGPAGLREIEPHVAGVQALWSPTTAIIDYRAVAASMAVEIRERGGEILLGTELTGIADRDGRLVLATGKEPIVSRHVIACAGLHADRVARMSGGEVDEQMVPFRGDYYALAAPVRHLVRGLIYPVPDPRFPFLGIHLTRRVDGEVLAGPNAVLAFKREGYRRRDFELADLRSVVAGEGFRRLARRHWRTGLAEMWRDVDKAAFAREVQRFVPELRRRDLLSGPSGVRAQAVDPDGALVDDFRLGSDGRILHVRNAPSPAATASLAIARHLVDEAQARLAIFD